MMDQKFTLSKNHHYLNQQAENNHQENLKSCQILLKKIKYALKIIFFIQIKTFFCDQT